MTSFDELTNCTEIDAVSTPSVQVDSVAGAAGGAAGVAQAAGGVAAGDGARAAAGDGARAAGVAAGAAGVSAVPNNKADRPLAHYRQLFTQADPQALAAKSGIAYSEDKQVFTLKVLNREFELAWPTGEVQGASSPLTILVLRLVLEGTLVPSTGAFIPYAKIPWGAEYLPAFTSRCINRLAYQYSCARGFALASQALGGIALQCSADEAYQFEFVPGVYIQALFWEGDEEFEPRAQILFSDNISFAFTAEDVAVIGDVLLNALKRGLVE